MDDPMPDAELISGTVMAELFEAIGFEVADEDLYYADCRPAFRSRYVRTLKPWELVEYDEDGEAIVRGIVPGGVEVIFELQNLTELNPLAFRETQLHVGI